MGKVKVKKKKKSRGACENCSKAVYCGDGCYACMESEEGPKWVTEDWGSAEDYLWCGGKRFEE